MRRYCERRMGGSEDEDDVPKLSDDVLAMVETVRREQMEMEERAKEGKELPKEDWQLSQFWYSEGTAVQLCEEVAAACSDMKSATVALLSTPTLLPYFKKLEAVINGHLTVRLFEFDQRFGELYPEEFVFFDYQNWEELPSSLKSWFDFIVADPPFLAEECLRKFAQTIRYIGKEESRVIVCTGAVMSGLVASELNARILPFKPQHVNNLANDFSAYANYDVVRLK